MQKHSGSFLMLPILLAQASLFLQPVYHTPIPTAILPAQVSGIIVPLLRFYFHEEVRIGAVQMLSELLRSSQLAAEKGAQGATKANVKQLLDYIWPALIDALQKVRSACLMSPPVSWVPHASAIAWLACVQLS